MTGNPCLYNPPSDMEPITFATLSALAFGLLFGSFANVVAYRVPRGVSIVLPGSFCTSCGEHVRALDNVPLLSFLLLARRCRSCRVPLSWRHPLVEATSGILAAASVLRFGVTGEALLFFALAAILLVLFLTDLDFHTLPDEITIPGIALGILAAIASQAGLLARTRGAQTFPEAALGVTGGAGVLLGIMFVYHALRGRAGMGVGDVKLLALIGAFLGFELTVMALLAAVFMGAVGGLLFVAVRGGGLGTALPFGTYLGAGTLLVLYFA